MNKIYTFKKLMALCLAMLLSIPYAMANNADTLSTNNVSLSSSKTNQPTLSNALNPNGTIKKGINGSFNAEGYKVSYGKGGQPIFSPATTFAGGELWDNSASRPEEGYATAIAFSGATAYIGMDAKIYKWNGSTQWDVIATVNGTVKAIAVLGTNVYVGGAFTTVNGNPMSHIAKFDTGTSTWSALGTGTDNTVNAIAVRTTNVYVGGDFVTAGGTTVNHIATWDTSNSTWNAMGTGVSITTGTATVKAVTVYSSNEVFVGGVFDKANGVTANRIANWNGAGWTTYGAGISNGSVNTIGISGAYICIGGDFTIPSTTYKNFSRVTYSGNNWSHFQVDAPVHSIIVSGANVFMAGEFSIITGAARNRVAYSSNNGTTWAAVGTGLGNPVRTLAFNSASAVHAVGDFTVTQVRKWTTSWETYQPTAIALNNTVRAITVLGNDIYVGGDFTTIGTLLVNRIAKYNTVSQTWSALGLGMNNTVNTIAIVGTDVYAGGTFTSAGGSAINRLAKWNGTAWSSVGGYQLNGAVNAIAVKGTDVYVGGEFTNIYSYIAKWDGTQWNGLPRTLNGYVSALAIKGDDLYVGGNFSQIYNPTPITYVANIVRFNIPAATWNVMGEAAITGGASRDVVAIAFSGNDVYVGGSLLQQYNNQAPPIAVSYIAKWDGTNWEKLGTEPTGYVRSLAVIGTDVYVGGEFAQAGGSFANKFAKWDGATWSNVNAWIDGNVYALAASGGKLHIGGAFTIAGGKQAPKFVTYIPDVDALPVELISYTATKQANGVALNWQTATESNNSHFVIEKSANGVNFTTLAQVPAKSPYGASYQYVDNQPQAQNYYRLTQVDYNGTITDLGVKVVNFGLPTSDIRLFPNPVTNNATLTFAPNTYTSLKVSNVAGQVLSTQAIAKGQSQASVNFSTYAKGVYVVQLTGRSGSQIIKVVKE